MNRPEGAVRGRAWAYVVSAAVLVAVAYPLTWDARDDSFPLSTYPMFSGRQSSRAKISHAVGLTEQGERVILPPEAVANDEVIQAYETVRQAISQGGDSTAALCDDAAGWAADHKSGVVSVIVVTDAFDAVEYFNGEREPSSSSVHAECGVAR
jgi:hypothetical protein